ncbi:hypothetical protein AX15_002180 [Amanita polypyramis BW_CC]|nr:hypothetical protein AX15_002180 [Amanita polypyramis BW_CC]
MLALPLSFINSFWSQDLRHGLDVLFRKLDQGILENDEIIALIHVRCAAEAQLAAALSAPLPLSHGGFAADDGASLLMAFHGLQAESAAQAKIHKSVTSELTTLVLNPFTAWALEYKERLRQSKSSVLDNWLRNYEQMQGDIQKLKQHYLEKIRRADDAEDDAKFAPTASDPDKYTSSPRLVPADTRQASQPSSVSDRITQRLRDIHKKSTSAFINATADGTLADPEQEPPKVDKGKGKAVDVDEMASPAVMSPLPPKVDLAPSALEPIVLGGIHFTPMTVTQLLIRAVSELPLRPVRFPLLGEYADAFTGEEFVTWLQENIKEFTSNIDLAEDAARVLTEQEGLLRRLGELGNQFEGSDDAFYQFRPKAFDLEGKKNLGHKSSSSIKGLQAESLLKRTGTLVTMVTKALNSSPNGEPTHLRARQEAEEADKTYRVAVRKLDRHRLALEERLEEMLKTLQRWEAERLRAIKTVLLQYQGIVANIPKGLEQSNERSATLIAAYQPESDLTALIERYRTGPFRPSAQIYESISHDEADVAFGIDLRKWAEGGWHELTSGEGKKELIPPVVSALFKGLDEAYKQLPNDAEKRKSWIYDVPLPPIHQLREVLNGVLPGQSFSIDLFKGYDAPVLASTIKLWFLELDPPLVMYEGWEEFRKIYPGVGCKIEGEITEEQRIQNVCTVLQKLPRVHLYVLNAFIKHLNDLINSTDVHDETDGIFITKLALSLGRSIIKPRQETQISIQDRHPTLLFIDLLNNYEAILPPTIAKKKRESERKVPIRKRTAPVDMRLSRSRISVGADAKQLLAAQQAAQNPSLTRVRSPPVPPLPSNLFNSETPQTATGSTEAADGTKPLVAPPSPPLLPSQANAPSSPPQVPPPPPLSTSGKAVSLNDELPPRPPFKEPPPELDDLPPRPTFKEPPPEEDDYIPPPMPKFNDPPAEEDNDLHSVSQPKSSSASPPAVPATNIIQSSPLKRSSMVKSNTGRTTPSNASVTSRSPSPPSEDVILGSGKTTITRSGSSQSGGNLRGPRGPVRRGGAVASAVANLNRSAVSGSPSGIPSGLTSPTSNRFSTGSPTRRPSSVLGRSAAVSRRTTLTSDAEEEPPKK